MQVKPLICIALLLALPLACATNQQKGGKDVKKVSIRSQATEGVNARGTLMAIDNHKLPYAPMHGGNRSVKVLAGELVLRNDCSFTSSISFETPKGEEASRNQKGIYVKKGQDYVLSWEGAGTTVVKLDGQTMVMNNEGMMFVYELTESPQLDKIKK